MTRSRSVSVIPAPQDSVLPCRGSSLVTGRALERAWERKTILREKSLVLEGEAADDRVYSGGSLL